MLKVWLRCDIRSPPFGTSSRDLCRIAIQQAAWADKLGFDTVQLPEHHGMPDGYNPSPLILGAAIAARTSRIRIHPSAVLLPLHDPIRIAEDTAVLDNISNGRVDLTIGLGYVQSEFAMFGISLKDRGRLIDEKLRVLRRALAGDKFEYEGRPVYVTPRPVQQPTPPLYVGGGVLASARRAAAIGDGFLPSALDDELRKAYLDACSELGKPPGPIVDVVGGPQFTFVTEDPDEGWAKIAPHAMYETNSYAKLLKLGGTSAPFKEADSIDELKRLGVYRVVTPDECVALGKSLESRGIIMVLNAMMAGLPEDLSWSSLELFRTKVWPQLQRP
jgi:alkanesulfonate monooxygenase SsuD/methylene tetrahydromethanopterin reductase-like flavin-dependent oxidoreductase (luciferase family)